MDSSCGRIILFFMRFLVMGAMLRVVSAQDGGPTGEQRRTLSPLAASETVSRRTCGTPFADCKLTSIDSESAE